MICVWLWSRCQKRAKAGCARANTLELPTKTVQNLFCKRLKYRKNLSCQTSLLGGGFFSTPVTVMRVNVMVNDDIRGVSFILLGMVLFSVQDVLIRHLADDGSLLQVLTFRGLLGTLVILAFMKFTNRPIDFSSSYPFLSATRVILFFSGFLCFYFALTGMPLAEATALFFASPLFITLISKFALREEVGAFRAAATIIGFTGVLFIVKPSPDSFNAISLLPIFSALTYSISMMIARYTKEKDTIWQQMTHLYIGSAAFGAVASLCLVLFGIDEADLPGGGYLVRGWSFADSNVVIMIGCVAAIGSLGMILLTSAYRLGTPAIIAPFEYSLLFMAGAWGYFLFDEIPDNYSLFGMFLIVASSLFIFFRESVRRKPLAVKTSLRT